MRKRRAILTPPTSRCQRGRHIGAQFIDQLVDRDSHVIRILNLVEVALHP